MQLMKAATYVCRNNLNLVGKVPSSTHCLYCMTLKPCFIPGAVQLGRFTPVICKILKYKTLSGSSWAFGIFQTTCHRKTLYHALIFEVSHALIDF